MKTITRERCLSRIKSAYKDGFMEGWDSSKLVSIASRWCSFAKYFDPQTQKDKIIRCYKRAHYYLKQARELSPSHNRGRINWLIARSLYDDFHDIQGAIRFAERSFGSDDDKEIYEFLFRACEESGDYKKAQKYSLKANVPGYRQSMTENPITNQEVENISIDNLMDKLIDPSNLK